MSDRIIPLLDPSGDLFPSCFGYNFTRVLNALFGLPWINLDKPYSE
jgi:hypothetical protein